MSTLALILALLAGATGFGAGWATRNIQLARWVERHHRAVIDGHQRLYAGDMPDGRSAERLPTGRYAETGE